MVEFERVHFDKIGRGRVEWEGDGQQTMTNQKQQESKKGEYLRSNDLEESTRCEDVLVALKLVKRGKAV